MPLLAVAAVSVAPSGSAASARGTLGVATDAIEKGASLPFG